MVALSVEHALSLAEEATRRTGHSHAVYLIDDEPYVMSTVYAPTGATWIKVFWATQQQLDDRAECLFAELRRSLQNNRVIVEGETVWNGTSTPQLSH